MCLNALPTCMYVYHTHACYLQKSEEGIRALDLELQAVVPHVGAGELSLVLCSECLTYISSPGMYILVHVTL